MPTEGSAIKRSEQLQDLHRDVALLSETLLKPYERCFITNYHLYRADCFQRIKGENSIAVRKGIPHNHVNLSGMHPVVSYERYIMGQSHSLTLSWS
jgi:hypothetical protein